MIRKHFVVGLTTVALAAAGLTAAPARASDDTVKILTGVAALAVLGTAIAKSKKNDNPGSGLSRGHSGHYKKHYKRGHRRSYSRGYHRHKYKYRHGHGGYHRKRYYRK